MSDRPKEKKGHNDGLSEPESGAGKLMNY